MSADNAHESTPPARLALAALGVVFGDIATSPLYALQEAFGEHGVRATEANVLGVVSLAFWTLIALVSGKYLLLVMRADNRGEGGIMALLALAQASLGGRPRLKAAAVLIGLAGAALFVGDSVITPAISVLSAVEGLRIAAPALSPFVVPLSVAILVVLFALQRGGSARMGTWFGPVMLAWLCTVGVFGLLALLRDPSILRAMDPRHGVQLFVDNGVAGFLTLGAIVLVMTGAEAMYADMGHFGAKAIRRAWSFVALPALVLGYFGQGATLLADPAAARAPFYLMVPSPLLPFVIVLATAATVIASQAVITGAYSLVREGMQLGVLPRMRVRHTSDEVRGQVYVPAMNGLLLVLVIACVLGFGSSSALAAAFGIAVSGTMLATTVLVMLVAWLRWGWSPWIVATLGGALVAIDVAFLGANLAKFLHGGWLPIAIGVASLLVMLAWRRGRARLARRVRDLGAPLLPVVQSLAVHPPQRVAGTAVFLTVEPEIAPLALLHNLKHNKVLHEENVILTVVSLDVPYTRPDERVEVRTLAPGFFAVHARFGFAEVPDVPSVLEACAVSGLAADPMQTTYFSGRDTVGRRSGAAGWEDSLFAFLARNSLPATAHFRIPDNRLVEIGRRVAL